MLGSELNHYHYQYAGNDCRDRYQSCKSSRSNAMAAEFSGGGGANQNQQPKGSQQPRFGKQRQRMRTASMPAENRKVSRKLRLNDKQMKGQ